MNHLNNEELNRLIDDPVQSEYSLHIKECPECRWKLDELKNLHAAMTRLEPDAAPEYFEHKVLEAISRSINQEFRMPLFIKSIITLFSLLIFLSVGLLFISSGSAASGNADNYRMIFDKYSGMIGIAMNHLLDSKFSSTILLGFLAMFTMSLYFLFEKIRALSK
ncbi:MAG: hypothetical protein HUU54_17025 [Ignavibacteriaceae bacterium]|nr:hypothetical protein [Ignavibacteriaceae bacterium]